MRCESERVILGLGNVLSGDYVQEMSEGKEDEMESCQDSDVDDSELVLRSHC